MSTHPRVIAERDFYRKLLDLSAQDDPMRFLRGALETVVEITGATQGLMQIQRDIDSDAEEEWISLGCTNQDLDQIRVMISHGIIAEAIASGETVQTVASSDDRFSANDSVALNAIDGVLCAPFGPDPAAGVVYLQRQRAPAGFSPDDRQIAEDFARYVSNQMDVILSRIERDASHDPTRRYREQMKLDAIVGRSRALAHVLNDAALVAPRTISVLLTGEPGTGKTQLARVIHQNSARADRPLVEVNCANLIDSLVESELFGAVRGVATQVETREGKVAAAEGGTLFLDEIGELTDVAQAKLLMLLNDQTYYRVGETTPRRADVRVIAATNKDIDGAVSDGAFRKDLLDRIGVLRLRMPSLRERQEDIPELVKRLLAMASTRHQLPARELSPGALRATRAHRWPGNVRELENTLIAGLLRAEGEGAARIEPRHLFVEEDDATRSVYAGRPRTLQAAIDEAQAAIIQSTLEEEHWNVKRSAQVLDCSRSHLHALMNLYRIKRPARATERA